MLCEIQSISCLYIYIYIYICVCVCVCVCVSHLIFKSVFCMKNLCIIASNNWAGISFHESIIRNILDNRKRTVKLQHELLYKPYVFIDATFFYRCHMFSACIFFFFLLNTLSRDKSCLVAPGLPIPPWATETVLSPCLAADDGRVSHVLSHVCMMEIWLFFLFIKILYSLIEVSEGPD